MLTHHKLKVYQQALAQAASADALSALWGRRHAIVEHYRRAAESIVLNIAEGARLLSGADKARTLDYAIGSALECAGCLDIASIKGRLSTERSAIEKRRFLEITRMLIGLRKAWLENVMREEPSPYQVRNTRAELEVLFHHESLDMYQVGLEFMRWFVCLPGVGDLSERLCREVDRSATSVVLNVAEGNGRYSQLDHRRFLDIAAASAVKTAAYVELYQQKALPACVETAPGRELMGRILAMLNKF